MKQQDEIDDYIASWHATMQLLREGKSFSGRERNCVFLNRGDSKFANVSSVSGLDFADDGRAVAAVDWDQDGDLDLWIQNRTGPRLRFLRNQTSELPDDQKQKSIAIRLKGVNSNRDGIGARVEVVRNFGPKLVQTLYAGDGYLSQSSKSLHFGLGTDATVEAVLVRWPDGIRERFSLSSDEPGSARQFQLVEGTGVATPLNARPPMVFSTPPQTKALTESSVRVQFANPVAIPLLKFYEADRTTSHVMASERPMLVILWASWCPNCIEELRQLASPQEFIAAGKLDVLALNVDELTSQSIAGQNSADEILRDLGFPFKSGRATSALMDKFRILQRVVLNRPLESAVPTSFLVNQHQELTTLYQGVHSVETFIDDAKQAEISVIKRRDLSVPFPGTWTTPPDVLLMRPVANVFREAGYRDDYERFLQLDRLRLARLKGVVDDEQQRRELEIRFATDSLDLGLSLFESGQAVASIEYFQEGLDKFPESAAGHFHLGKAFLASGKTGDAVNEFQTTLRLNPSYFQASFELGLLAASGNRLNEASEYFQKVVELQPSHVNAWSNLGAVYARLRQPNEAIEALSKAIVFEPGNVQSLLFLGGQLATQAKYAEAAVPFRRVTELAPTNARAFAALGQVQVKMRDDSNAVITLKQAIRLDPRDVRSRLQLAWLQATSPNDSVRDGQASLAAASELAMQSQSRDPRVLDVLAAAYAEVGRFREAAEVARKALSFVPKDHPLHKVVRDRIDRFENNKPFRDQPDGQGSKAE